MPILRDSVVSMSCEVTKRMEAGSHSVFIGTIVAIETGEGAALIYEQSRFHRLTPLQAVAERKRKPPGVFGCRAVSWSRRCQTKLRTVCSAPSNA